MKKRYLIPAVEMLDVECLSPVAESFNTQTGEWMPASSATNDFNREEIIW